MIKSIGDYQILKEISSGGMATVYLAISTKTNNKVAIKLLKEELLNKEKVLDRFTQEGLLKLYHKNIVKVLDLGIYKSKPFIAMEYIDGYDLEYLLNKKGPPPIDKAISIFKQILAALSYVHSKNIIHRDIKPKNILIDKNGNVKLTDFGIAKALYSNVKTSTGSYLGAPAYSSPEQMDGKLVDARSDIYSLGVTLYEMLSGKIPFSSTSIENIIKEKFIGNPIPITRYKSDMPQYILYIIDKCIARNPQNRFDSVEEILKVINTKSIKDSNYYNNKTIVKDINENKSRSIFIDKKKRKDKIKKLGIIFGVLGFIIVVTTIILIVSNIKDSNKGIAVEEDALEENIGEGNKSEDLLKIRDIIASQRKIETGGQIDLSIDIENDINDLQIEWESKDGFFLQDGTADTKWIAPYLPGEYTITVIVTNGIGLTDSEKINVEVTEKIVVLESDFLEEVYNLLEEYEVVLEEMFLIHGEDVWYIDNPKEISLEETFPPKLERLSNKLKGFSYPDSYTNDRNYLIKIADELCFYQNGIINCMKNNDYDGYLNYFDKFNNTMEDFYIYYNKMVDNYNDKYDFE